MPDPNDKAAAGLTEDRVNEIIINALKPTTDALSKLTGTVTELAGNQKVLADTFAASAAADADKNKTGKKTEEPPLTMDAITSTFTKMLDQRDTQREQTASQRAARADFIKSDKSGLAKLPSEYQDRLGADPAKWADEAKSIAESFSGYLKANNLKLPDVGGAARDGGSAASDPNAPTKSAPAVLPDTLKKVAEGIKLPA